MPKINLDDTIAAIATPIGEGGIGIVRLSGKEALFVADKIFVSKDGKKPSDYETYTTHYGYVVDRGYWLSPSGRLRFVSLSVIGSQPKTENRQPKTEIIDEVILTVMKAPKSYTKEDVVEINCHGGIVPLKKTLELVLGLGARLAEPGEFTRRAFLNGRIDLVQAEAVLDIVKAKTQKGLEAALLQLQGALSASIRSLKDNLLDVKAHLEASVDFPGEDLSTYSIKGIEKKLNDIKSEIEDFIKSFESGKIVRDGITCVICGKPNVGKSSLMNGLLREERVIVTPVPGTTRDAICEYMNIEGIPMQIVDTAGISKTDDIVEKEGIIRSKLYIDRADLVLFMMDQSAGFSSEDREIIDLIKQKEVICIINKIDLAGHINMDEPEKDFGKKTPVVEISVLKKTNMNLLFENIVDAVWKGRVFANDLNILTNARHKDSLLKALRSVNEAMVSLKEGQPEDIIAISVGEAILTLGEVTGESAREEVLDRIFEQFCVGK